MEKTTRIVGSLAIAIGLFSTTLTSLFLIKPLRLFVFAAILTGLAGFICSNIYIFLNLRYRVSEKRMTPGMWGILFSSAPIVLILVTKLMHKS